jgi:hypothetical protein
MTASPASPIRRAGATKAEVAASAHRRRIGALRSPGVSGVLSICDSLDAAS